LKKKSKDIFQIFLHTIIHEAGHVADDRKPGRPAERKSDEPGNDFEDIFFGSHDLNPKIERKRYDYENKNPNP